MVSPSKPIREDGSGQKRGSGRGGGKAVDHAHGVINDGHADATLNCPNRQCRGVGNSAPTNGIALQDWSLELLSEMMTPEQWNERKLLSEEGRREAKRRARVEQEREVELRERLEEAERNRQKRREEEEKREKEPKIVINGINLNYTESDMRQLYENSMNRRERISYEEFCVETAEFLKNTRAMRTAAEETDDEDEEDTDEEDEE